MAALREDWRARAGEHGLGSRELRGLLGHAVRREPSREQLVRSRERLLGPEGLTKQQTAFTEPEALMAWAEAHRSGASAERLRTLAARIARAEGVERVGELPSPGRPARYSTNELLPGAGSARTGGTRPGRGRAVSHPRAARGDRARRPDPPFRRAGTDGAGGRDQATASCASSGWRARARRPPPTPSPRCSPTAASRFVGAAPSGVAAEKLQDETGIPSSTLHRLLDQARSEGGLPHGSVLVVDEAAMAETRILAPVLGLVEQATGRRS